MMLCAKFGEIGPVVLETKMKMWKVYDDNDVNNDDDGQRTHFGELKIAYDEWKISLGHQKLYKWKGGDNV